MSDELPLGDIEGCQQAPSACTQNKEKNVSSDPTKSQQQLKTCYCPDTFFASIITLILFLSVATLGTLIYFYIKQPFRKDVCLTENCTLAASRLMSYMDNSVDPCVNFYDYACGRRVKALAMNDKKSVTLSSILQESINEKLRVLLESHEDNEPVYKRKPRLLYSLCMNSEQLSAKGTEPFFNLINKTGGFPALQPDWNEKDFDLESMLSNLAQLGLFPLIEFGVTYMHGTSFFYVTDGELLFKKYVLDIYGLDVTLDRAYEKWLTSNLLSLNKHEAVSEEVEDIIAFQYFKAQYNEREENMNNFNTSSNVTFTNITMLKRNYTRVDWQKLFQSYNPGMNVTGDTEVLYTRSKYMESLDKIIAGASKRSLANYLMSALFNFTEFLGPKFLKFKGSFFKSVEDIQIVELWEHCVELQKEMFPLYVNRLYAETYVNNQDLEQIKNIFSETLKALISMVDDNDWISEEMKSKAGQKIKNMDARIGYSEIIYNDSFVDSLYEHITIIPNNYFETMINYVKYTANKEVINTGDTKNQKSAINAISTNGRSHILTNELVLQPDIVQYPLYSSMYTSSMTYGAFGMIIGRELIHTLDPGLNFNSWWRKEDREKFQAISKCFEDQYNRFSFKGKSVNGISSLEENICDNNGLKLSLKAYNRYTKRRGYKDQKLPGLELNHNQIFFLSFAQAWCSYIPDEDMVTLMSSVQSPDKFRVLGSLQNSKEFAETFQCSPGTPMNPLKNQQ